LRPLFSRLKAEGLRLGLAERTAGRKAREIAEASFSDFIRVSPAQSVEMGFSPLARRYALKGDRTALTISARAYETKRASELHGMTPAAATEARKHGMVSYASAGQRERVAKAALTREENKVVEEIKTLQASRESVPSYSPDKRRHGRFHPVTPEAEHRYREIRRRKLAGEHIADGEWHWFIDYARRFKDPRYELLRGSPAAFGFTLSV
jgi:hypothetical protein